MAEDAYQASPEHHLALEAEHERLGARMIEFAGWRMPLSYGSIIEEHMLVRSRMGLFDVSHMGKLLVRGTGAFRSVQGLVPTAIDDLEPGQARYTMLLTPSGGVLDDIIVYRREDGFLLIVNAARTEEDRDWVDEHLDEDAQLDDLTMFASLFALQGPLALEFLQRLTEIDLGSLPAFTFASGEVTDVEATVMRTGYTGERGVELLTDNADAAELWRTLLAEGSADGLAPAGLGARDTLRLEAGLLLNGQDMTQNATPFELGMAKMLDLEGHDFVGREALLELRDRRPERLLVGLVGEERGIPRTGTPILAEGRPIGRVTSGSISPVLGKPIALGFVSPEHAEAGRKVMFQLRNRTVVAEVVKPPFYKRSQTPSTDSDSPLT